MKNSKQIEREIADLQKRRETVAGSHAAAHSDLQAARARMIKGQASPDEVGAAQSAYNGLSGALEEADEQLSTLRAELAEATAREQREENAARVNELTAMRDGLGTEYRTEQTRLSEFIAASVEKLLELTTRFNGAGREIAELTGADVRRSQGQLRDAPTEYAEPIATAMRIKGHRLDRESRQQRAA
jgi:predicted  nucleic acid-binding Zn-ribbon protein